MDLIVETASIPTHMQHQAVQLAPTLKTPHIGNDAGFQATDLSSIQRICGSFVLVTLDWEIRTKSANVLWTVSKLVLSMVPRHSLATQVRQFCDGTGHLAISS